MSEAVAAVWSVEQQRLLQAMGYQLLRPVQGTIGSAALTQAACSTAMPAANFVSMRPRLSLIRFPPTAESTAQQMLVVVLRATGLTLDDVELLPATASEIEIALPPLDLLLSSAVARRALWPQLRKLRRRLVGPPPR